MLVVLAVVACGDGTDGTGVVDASSDADTGGPDVAADGLDEPVEGPAVLGVEPTTLPIAGGGTLTVRGRGFRPGLLVELGGIELPVVAASTTEIVCGVPPLVAGLLDLVVTLPGGEALLLEDAVSVAERELAFVELPSWAAPPLDARATALARFDVTGDGSGELVVASGEGLQVLSVLPGPLLETVPREGSGPSPLDAPGGVRDLVVAGLLPGADAALAVCSGAGGFVLGGSPLARIDIPVALVGCERFAAGELDGADGLELVVAAELGDGAQLAVLRADGAALLLDDSLSVPAGQGDAVGEVGGVDDGDVLAATLDDSEVAAGVQSVRLDYDLGAGDGVAVFWLPASLATKPDSIRFSIRGDASGVRAALRVRDANGDSFEADAGAIDFTGWRVMGAAVQAGWAGSGGEGVLTLPITSVGVALHAVAAARAGVVHVDAIAAIEGGAQTSLDPAERLEPAVAWPDRTRDLVVADIDGDGLDDILRASAGGVELLLNRGGLDPEKGRFAFAFERRVIDAAPAEALAVLDANGDGRPDIYVARADARDGLLIADDAARFADLGGSMLPLERADGRAVAVADLDLDGLDDVVIATDGQADRLYRNTGVRFDDLSPRLGLDTRDDTAVLLVDLDGDDLLDIVTAGTALAIRVRGGAP